MVHNAKQKFLAVSCVLSFAVVGMIIGAIATPSWVTYSLQDDEPQYQGLFKACRNGECSNNQFAADGQGLLGNLGCKQSGSELQDRFSTTAGTLIAAAAIAFVVVAFQFFHITRLAKLSQAAHMWLFWALILAFVSSLVGIAVFGGTVNSWWNCGSDYCQPYKSTSGRCGVGYGYVFSIVACAVLLLSAVVVVTFTKFPHIMFPTNDVVLLAVLLEAFAIVLISIGVSSPEWVVVIYNYGSLGLFQDCTAWSCSAIDLPTTISTRTNCQITGSSVTSRLSAAAALMIVAAVITAVLAVLFAIAHLRISTKLFITNTKKRVTMVFIALAFILQTVAIVLATNVVDSYYYCGVSFCTEYSGFCRPGVAFGLAIGSVSVTGLLFVVHVFEFNSWCCFQERFASGRQSFSVWKVLRGTKDDSTEPTATAAPGATPKNAPTVQKVVDENTIQLPSGQWDYDTVSGFYWSEELYLFFDPVTQQFYDPNKDEWFAQDRRTAAAGITSNQNVSYPDLSRMDSRGGGSVDRGGRGGAMHSPQGSEMARQTSPRRVTPRR